MVAVPAFRSPVHSRDRLHYAPCTFMILFPVAACSTAWRARLKPAASLPRKKGGEGENKSNSDGASKGKERLRDDGEERTGKSCTTDPSCMFLSFLLFFPFRPPGGRPWCAWWVRLWLQCRRALCCRSQGGFPSCACRLLPGAPCPRRHPMLP